MTVADDRQAALYAAKLLANADTTLAAVDDSYIIKERGHAIRPMPTFRPEEISLGKLLGTGGFGVVNEVKSFCLDADDATRKDTGAASADNLQTNPTDTNSINHTTFNNLQTANNNSKARHVLASRAYRNGEPRYALKRLRGTLATIETARGRIDLAIEAKYLSVVWHPNIIKLRGMASGSLIDPDFFIIMDRLFATMVVRIEEWRQRAKGTLFGMMIGKKNKLAQQQLLVERMTVAYDLAAAFFYLHENRLIYRDIKPENIGFDVRGDVKVFDFGLCKSLSHDLRARDGGYGYRLTGRAGSIPYMAPEVVKMETYDTKCDVFSYAILLWEMLTLKQAYSGMSPTDFVERVVLKRERPPISKKFPPLTRLMIHEAWDDDPRKRPDMKRVAILIRSDLNDMTTDDTIKARTKHMEHRSEHSMGELSYTNGEQMNQSGASKDGKKNEESAS